MYILLVHYYNGTPEPITAQLLVWSELVSTRRDNRRVILVCSCVALPAVKPTGGIISLFLVVNSNYLIKKAFYQKSNYASLLSEN